MSLNQFFAKFREIADNHAQIKQFQIAQPAEISADKATLFPLLMCLELPYATNGGVREYRFRFMIMDRLYPDNPGSNREDVISDTDLIAHDVLAKLKAERNLWILTKTGIQFESFEGRYLDDVAGWSFDVAMRQGEGWDACSVPYDPTVWDVFVGGTSQTIIPAGVKDGDTINLKSNDPIGVVTLFSAFPNGISLRFRADKGKSIVIANNYNGTLLFTDNGYNTVLETGILITISSVNGILIQTSGQGVTYPNGIYITGVNGAHEANVLATYLAQYPEAESRIVKGYLPYPDSGLPSASIFFNQIMQAGGYRCEQLTISYTSAISNIALRDYISNQIPSVVLPIGGNSNVEIMSPTTMLDNSFVFVSGGNGTQRTLSYGNALEFWDSNSDNSYVVPLIAAKLMQIADGREDGDNLFQRHVGARWAARATAIKNGTTHPNGQVWNKENGYGRPSVSGAIAYTGQVPPSIYVAIQDFTFSLIFN